ncbi:MAG TPA: VOC family protein, partial [Acidimicrobiales bacterium]|nr:VOC family protein [Acidimicrobiales bacterium]
PDMDATVRFYHGVLGMRLVATLMAGPMRHYFFEIGPENTVAFFEWQGAPTFAKPAGVPIEGAVQFDHLSFNLPDEQSLHDLRDRLLAAEVEITEVVDHDIMHSVYFTDPNGIALEASWWVVDVTGRPAAYGDDRVFSDPDPVPAVRELAGSGELAWMPVTHLSGELILDPS